MTKLVITEYYMINSVTSEYFLDIDFWKVPSRKFYIAEREEYQELSGIIKQEKRSLKRKTSSHDSWYDDYTFKMQESLAKVCVIMYASLLVLVLFRLNMM